MKRAKRAMPLAILVMCALAGSAFANQMYVGETAIGQMTGAGSVHDLYVDMAAGDRVVLKVTARGAGLLAPNAVVTAPNGAQIANLGGQRKMKVGLVAQVTGTYHIQLTDPAGASGQFAVILRGSRARTYRAGNGSLDFGAVAGSIVNVRVRARRAAAWAGNPVGQTQGQVVGLALLSGGRNLSAVSGPVAATDQYRMAFGPAGSEAKVRVRSPRPRGRIDLGAPSSGGPSTGPAPAPSPAPPQPTPPNPAPPAPPADDPAGDPPGDDADEAGENYLLAALLEGERDADVMQALAALEGQENESVELALDRLREELEDEVIDRMKAAISARGLGSAAVREIGIQRIAEILDAERRHQRAQARLDALNQEREGTELAGDKAFDDAAIALEERRKSLSAAVEEQLPGFLWMQKHALDGAFDAPAAAKDEQARADMQRLDEQILAARMAERARQGEEIAIDVMIAFYKTWLAMLAGLDNDNPMAEQIRETVKEMQALADAMNAEPVPAMQLMLRAHGAESQMDVDFQPQLAEGEKTEEGLSLKAHSGVPIAVQWDAGGSRGFIEIVYRFEEGQDRLQILVRAGDNPDQSAVVFEPGNVDGVEEMEATPDGFRVTAQAQPDGSITVLWTLDDIEGGIELRVMARP